MKKRPALRSAFTGLRHLEHHPFAQEADLGALEIAARAFRLAPSPHLHRILHDAAQRSIRSSGGRFNPITRHWVCPK